jgi:dsDNA-binding SOS-regulon protein
MYALPSFLPQDEGPRRQIVAVGGAAVVCRVLDSDSSSSFRAAADAVVRLVEGGPASQQQLAEAGALLRLTRLLADQGDSCAVVRTTAARALTKLAASPAVRSDRLLEAAAPLARLLEHECPEVNEAARQALAAMAARRDPGLSAALAWGAADAGYRVGAAHHHHYRVV